MDLGQLNQKPTWDTGHKQSSTDNNRFLIGLHSYHLRTIIVTVVSTTTTTVIMLTFCIQY